MQKIILILIIVIILLIIFMAFCLNGPPNYPAVTEANIKKFNPQKISQEEFDKIPERNFALIFDTPHNINNLGSRFSILYDSDCNLKDNEREIVITGSNCHGNRWIYSGGNFLILFSGSNKKIIIYNQNTGNYKSVDLSVANYDINFENPSSFIYDNNGIFIEYYWVRSGYYDWKVPTYRYFYYEFSTGKFEEVLHSIDYRCFFYNGPRFKIDDKFLYLNEYYSESGDGFFFSLPPRPKIFWPQCYIYKVKKPILN